MARVRTFLAVPLSDDQRDNLAGLQESLARGVAEVMWTAPENLHVTLVFLGDVVEEEIPAICRAAQNATSGMSPFTFSVKGVGAFPSPRRPRILWAGITAGAEGLRELYERLTQQLEPLGFRREDRPFTPHVTLGRVKAPQSGKGLAKELEAHNTIEPGETTVQEVHIYSSKLLRPGPRYQLLGRARLQSDQ